MAVNGYLHQSITYGRWKDWDGTPLDENPLFYNGLDEFSAGILSGASDEVVATTKAIKLSSQQQMTESQFAKIPQIEMLND